MVLVRGKTRKILLKAAGKSCATATTVSFSVSFSYWTRRCSTAVKTIGVAGNSRLAITLYKGSGGCADSDDEIDWPTGVEGAKILRKQTFRVFIFQPGIHQRLVEKIHRLLPTSANFRPNGLLVVAPRFETRTE